MTKRQIVSELLHLSRELEAKKDVRNCDTLIRVAGKVAEDEVKEVELGKSRRGAPVKPQNAQLEETQGDTPEDVSEVRLEKIRKKN